MLHPGAFFDLSSEMVAALFVDCEYVWQLLSKLEEQIERLLASRRRIMGEVMAGAHLSDRHLFVGRGARIEPGAYVLGPAYIGDGAVVRHGAFVRENVILMTGSVLGHASEAKNSLFLPGAHAPHFNYVGDSVLGYNTNLGAGTKVSNLTLVSQKDPDSGKRPSIRLVVEGREFDTGLSKLGAILGDGSQTGCNAVLNPGCLIGPNAIIYANLSLPKGYYPPNSVIKLRQTSEHAQRF